MISSCRKASLLSVPGAMLFFHNHSKAVAIAHVTMIQQMFCIGEVGADVESARSLRSLPTPVLFAAAFSFVPPLRFALFFLDIVQSSRYAGRVHDNECRFGS